MIPQLREAPVGVIFYSIEMLKMIYSKHLRLYMKMPLRTNLMLISIQFLIQSNS